TFGIEFDLTGNPVVAGADGAGPGGLAGGSGNAAGNGDVATDAVDRGEVGDFDVVIRRIGDAQVGASGVFDQQAIVAGGGDSAAATPGFIEPHHLGRKARLACGIVECLGRGVEHVGFGHAH